MQPQFIGPSYNLESRPASVQRTVNMIPSPVEPGNERTAWEFEDVPGLSVFLVDTGGGSQNCIVGDDFSGGIGGYSTLSGNSSLFTAVSDTYGLALQCASQNSLTVSLFSRSFGSVTGQQFSFKVKVTSNDPDDAAIIGLSLSAVPVFRFNPRRETVFDALRRPVFILGAESVQGASSLLNGAWYDVLVSIVPGVGLSSYSITNIATGVVHSSGSFAGSFTNITTDQISFTVDSGTATCTTIYDDICLSV